MSDSTSGSGRGNSSLIGAIANPQVINPLAAFSSAVNTAGAVYSLRDKQADQAWGQALQAATDPQTGTVDYGRAQQLAAQNPLAAMGMGRYLQASSGLKTAQQEQTIRHMGLIGGAAMTVVNDPSDANLEMVRTSLLNAGLPQSAVDQEIQTLRGMSPDQRRAYALQHGMAALDPQGRFTASVGQTGTAVTPQGVVPYVQGGIMTGGRLTTAPGSIGYGMSPAQLNQQITYKDDQGVEHSTTLGEYLKTLGVPTPSGTGFGGGGGGQAPAAPSSGGTPQAPPSPTNQPRLNSPPAAPEPPKSIPGPQPGMQEKWKASADQYNAENAASGQFQQRLFPLAQVDALLGSGDLTTGPGAEGVNRIKEWLATRAATFGWDAQTIQQAKFDELNKYLTQVVNANPFAGGSDQRLASAISGNPSAHIATLANKDVIKAMIGLERYRQAAMLAAKAQNVQPKDFSDFQSKFASTYDPRAFVIDRLKPEQQEKMIKGMSEAERKTFNASLQLIESNPSLMNLPAMPH